MYGKQKIANAVTGAPLKDRFIHRTGIAPHRAIKYIS